MISGHHLRAAASYPGNEVLGLVDRDIGRARAQAERFTVKRTFDNLADLLALKPDVVHVLTPPALHLGAVVEALQGGAHVYVEKPMALSVADCEAMTRAAAAADRQLCVGHNWLYTPALLEAQELIAKGGTGEIVQAAASFNYDVRRNPSFGQHHWSKDLPGGLAEDLAVHMLGAIIRLLGAPLRTYAVSRSAPAVPGGKTADVRAVVEAERGLGTIAVVLACTAGHGLARHLVRAGDATVEHFEHDVDNSARSAGQAQHCPRVVEF